jgi:hypothetical protein
VGTDQIHDFNPGIDPFPAGLFWTVAIPEDSVALNLGRGIASYRLSNFVMEDYGNIGNALNDGSSVPGLVSFDVEWSGVVERATTSDASNQFALSLARTGASINWTGSSSLGSFASDGVTKVNFAQIAHETNGIFFGA